MGIINREGSLYLATGIDNTGLYSGRREAMGIIKAMAGQITSFDVFSGIGISAATVFASAAKSSYDFEKEFHKNMLEVATISTQVTDDMTGFMNLVMSITQEIPIKAPEAAKALYQIVSAGHDGADGMHILEVSAKSAIGGMTDAATASDAITTLINAYKLSVSDAEKVSDQLFTTARLGKTTFGELGQSIAQVAPIAASYGVEMDQVLAAVATLTKSGTPTAQAMTQIRAAIIGVSKYLGDGVFNAMTFQEAMDKIAKEANGSESALRGMITEVEAVNGVLGMTGIKAQDAAADLKAMNDSAGSTEAAFKLMMNDVDKQMTLLSNNIQAALRPMGEAILKEVSEVATAFNEAFEDGDAERVIKSLGDLVLILAGAVITYKGAILASTAAQRINVAILRQTVLERKMENMAVLNGVVGHQKLTTAQLKAVATRKMVTSAVKVHTAAILKNVAAMATNPYVLAAAALTTLGVVLYQNVLKATEAEKAQKRLNDAVKDAEKGALSEQRELAKLKGELSATTKGTDEYSKIRDKIVANYGKYDKNLKDEIDTVGLLDETYKKLTISIQQSFGARQYEKFIQDQGAALDDVMSDNLNEIYDKLIAKWGEEAGTKYYTEIKNALMAGEKIPEHLNGIVHNMYGIWAQSLHNYIDNIKDAQKATEDADRKARVKFGIDESSTNGKQDGGDGTGTSAGNTPVVSTVIKEITAARNEVNKLKKELADLRSGKTTVDAGKTVQAAIEAKATKLKKAEDTLATLTGQSTKDSDKRLSVQQELVRAILESELKLQSERLSIMQDGKDKRVLLADQEYKETLAAIQKERDEYQKKIAETKGTPDPDVLSTFTSRENTAKDKRDTDVAGINKEYVQEFADRQKEMSSIFLSEEAKRLSAVKDRYEKERKWAEEQHKTGGLNDDEYKSYLGTIDKAEGEETLKALLDKYQDYDTQRRELERNYTEEVSTLSAQRTEENKAEVDAALQEALKRHKEELANLDFSEFQESDLWKKMFGDLDKMALPSLQNILDKAKEVNTKGFTPEQIKEYQAAIDRLEEAIRTRSPFKSLRNDWINLMKAIREGNKDDTAKALSGIDTAVQKINAGLDTIAGGIGDVFGDEAGYAAGQVAELTSAIGGFASAASKIAGGDILGGITSVVSSIGSIFSMGKKVKEMNREAREEQQKFYDEARAGELEYQALLRERLRLTQQIGETSLQYFDRLQKELHKQSGSITEEYDEVWAKLMGEQYIEKVNYRHGTWFRKAKTWNDYGSLAGKSYEEIESLYTQNKLTDSAKVLFEELRKLKEEGADVVDMMDDLNQSMNEAWTGTTEDAIAQSILDGISAGKTGVDDLTGYFRDMMKSAMLQGVNMKYLQTPIKKFYEQFAEMSESGGMLTESEIKQLQEMYTQMFENAEAQFENLKKISGLDFSTTEEETSDNSLKGAFAKASQESIDLLAGQTGAQRVAIESIREQMQFIRELQTQGWKDVATIKELVGKLKEISDRIDRTTEDIKKATTDISEHSKRTVEALESTLNVKVKM